MSTLICFALKEEAAPFQKIVADKSGVTVLITGIGRQNAEKSVRGFLAGGASVLASQPLNRSTGLRPGAKSVISSNAPGRRPALHSQFAGMFALPSQVFTCGFAGGLNPDLKIGDVVFEIGNQKSEIGNQLMAAGARPAKFFCADRIATTVAEKQKLRVETDADAVEMESAAIHVVCAEQGIPCATVRVISDTAQEDLPLDFNALAKPDKSIDFGKLAWAIAKSPGKIGALMALQKKTKFAAEQLAAVLAKAVFPPA
jgi:hypothetical protein